MTALEKLRNRLNTAKSTLTKLVGSAVKWVDTAGGRAAPSSVAFSNLNSGLLKSPTPELQAKIKSNVLSSTGGRIQPDIPLRLLNAPSAYVAGVMKQSRENPRSSTGQIAYRGLKDVIKNFDIRDENMPSVAEELPKSFGMKGTAGSLVGLAGEYLTPGGNDLLKTYGTAAPLFAGLFGGPKAVNGMDIIKTKGFTNTLDKMPRFEIPDIAAALKSNFTSKLKGMLSKKGEFVLDDVLEHRTLFNRYPQLKNVRVIADPNLPIGTGGEFDSVSNVIKLNPRYELKEVRRSLLHEIQHGIQEIEGFAGGGNPNQMLEDAFEARNSIVRQLQRVTDNKVREELMQQLKQADDKAFGMDKLKEYKKLMGELEARTVANRADLPDSLRYTTDPYYATMQSEGLKVSDLIINKGRGVSASAEQVTSIADDPVKKIVDYLKGAKPIRGMQETLYTQTRGQRLKDVIEAGKVGGEKGFLEMKGKLKGEMPKVDYEPIRPKFTQTEIDSFFDKVKNSPNLNEWDVITANNGLLKMLDGTVPTEGELKLLNKVYGNEFTKAVLDKRSGWQKISEAITQVTNLPKALVASYDLSAPFRQGAFLIGRPKEFLSSFKQMFKTFGSEKAFKAMQEEIANRPTYPKMKEYNLALTETGSFLSNREEQFLSSWAEQIPVIGKGVKASERAYVGFLNKLRADVFDSIVSKNSQYADDPEFLSKLTDYINTASGRGSLGKLEKVGNELNNLLFSPRLMSSRLKLLPVTPVSWKYYAQLHPAVRQEALKDLSKFVGIQVAIMSLAKMSGAKVETDPRNPDFGKIKIGNTRIDTMGGFQQYVRLVAQVASGKAISSTTGKEFIMGKGYGSSTRADTLIRFMRMKTSPLVSMGWNALEGENVVGEKFDVKKDIPEALIPLIIQDVYDLAKRGEWEVLPFMIPAAFGVGVQNYSGVPAKIKNLNKPVSKNKPLSKNKVKPVHK